MVAPSKRKAPEELSDNPNTVKARKRIGRISLDTNALQVEKAKNADRAAVTYAKGRLKKTAAYLAADTATQAQMLVTVADEVMLKRIRDGKDADILQNRLGMGAIGGFYAVKDDGNPVWEDIDYESEDDLEFEQRWRDDDTRNGEIVVKKDQEMSTMFRSNAIADKHRLLAFFTWQRKWNGARRSLFRKNRMLGSSVEKLDRVCKPRLDKDGFAHWTPPSKFFTKSEKAVWRNLAIWAFDEWVPLPGPAEWWPDDSKAIDDLGFRFSEPGYEYMKAMEIVIGAEPDADLYLFAEPGSDELRLLTDTPENRAWLDAFYAQNF